MWRIIVSATEALMNLLCSFHSCIVYEIKLNIPAYVFLQELLYPPSNISLHLTGEVGQLLVKWKKTKTRSLSPYEIRYSSKHTSSTVGPVSLTHTLFEILLYQQ